MIRPFGKGEIVVADSGIATLDSGDTFAPHIQVLTPAPATPKPLDLSWDVVVQRFPGLVDAESVAWTGSLVVGWGNAWSDVDFYAFADRDLNLPCDDSSETWPSTDESGIRAVHWMGRYGDVCADLQVWPTDVLERILAPFTTAPEPEFCRISDELQDFIYRMSIAAPLRNDDYFARARQLIHGSSYRRALARFTKAHAEIALTDVGGQLDSGDAMSARVTGLLAAYKAADVCLLLAGELCRKQKWLLRRIEATPECGISVDEYRTEVMGGLRPGESDADAALRLANWAQSHLIRVENEVLSVAG